MAKKTVAASNEVLTPEVIPPEKGLTYEVVKQEAKEIAAGLIKTSLDGYRALGQVVLRADKSGGKQWIKQLSSDLDSFNLGVSVPNLYKMQQYVTNVSDEQHTSLKELRIGWSRACEIGQNSVTPQQREKVITDLETKRVTPEKLGTTLKAMKAKAKKGKGGNSEDGVDADALRGTCKMLHGIGAFADAMAKKALDVDFKAISAVNEADEAELTKIAEGLEAAQFGLEDVLARLKKQVDAVSKAVDKRSEVLAKQRKAAEKAKK